MLKFSVIFTQIEGTPIHHLQFSVKYMGRISLALFVIVRQHPAIEVTN